MRLHSHFPTLSRPNDESVVVRFFTLRDLSSLRELEHEKWDATQAASQSALIERIEAHPKLAMGAFCSRTGYLLSSLFLKPVADDFHRHVHTWEDCTRLSAAQQSRSLFGISLSSRHQKGVDALIRFFLPHALKSGWRHVYLGSPVPGLRDWRRHHPEGRVEDYVLARRSGMPLDPQLRYYSKRGFTRIIAVKPGYFPHERSLDYGVLLRSTILLSHLAPLWTALPLPGVKRVTRPLAALL